MIHTLLEIYLLLLLDFLTSYQFLKIMLLLFVPYLFIRNTLILNSVWLPFH